MASIIASGILGLCVGLVMTPVSAAVARRVGLVDYPNERKRHGRPTPLVGGPVLAVAGIGGALALGAGGAEVWALLGALVFLAAIGVVDDKYHVSARWKFLAQGVATAALMMVTGIFIRGLGQLGWGGAVHLGWALGVAFTIFAVVGVINAVNMVDGVDGLAGGLSLVALASFVATSRMGDAGWGDLWIVAFAIGGALLGFLAYNAPVAGRPRARAFLGDSGTLLVGFLLAWLAVRATQPDMHPSLPPMLAVWFLALPILDTVTVMLRRALAGRSPFSPDRLHLHHLCLRHGWSVARTTYTLCTVQGLAGLASWQAWRAGLAVHWLLVSYVALFAIYFVFSWSVTREEHAGDRWARLLDSRSGASVEQDRSG